MPTPLVINPLTNPYGPSLEGLHKISGYVSHADYFYLKQLFPNQTGLAGRIISILFNNLIQDLKDHGLDPDKPGADHIAWISDHPTYNILKACLVRRPTGQPVGSKGGRNERRRVGSVRSALCDSSGIQPDSEGGAGQGKRKTRGRKKVEEDQRGSGTGTVGPTPTEN